MNPPFGESSGSAKKYVDTNYPTTKSDLLAAFVDRGVALSKNQGGLLGAITSRTCFFLSSFATWRESLTSETPIFCTADLGYGVLDSATVETAAYCISTRSSSVSTSDFIRLIDVDNREESLQSSINDMQSGSCPSTLYSLSAPDFQELPGSPFAYWFDSATRSVFLNNSAIGGDDRAVKQGLATAEDFRFLRTWWEVPTSSILNTEEAPDWSEDLKGFRTWCRDACLAGNRWVSFAKGGGYSKYYTSVYLVVNWRFGGREIKGRLNPKYGRPYSNVWQLEGTERDLFYSPGLVFPRRIRRFGTSLLPAGCIFSDNACTIFFPSPQNLQSSLSCYSSLPTRYLLSGLTVTRKFEVGIIRSLPFVSSDALIPISKDMVASARSDQSSSEVSRWFVSPIHPNKNLNDEERKANLESQKVFGLNHLSEDHLERFVSAFEQLADDADADEAELRLAQATSLVSYAVGVLFYRWDVKKYATINLETSGPFDPLPVVSPAMLRDYSPKDYPFPATDGIIETSPQIAGNLARKIVGVLEFLNVELKKEDVLCTHLGVRNFEDYISKPSGYFSDHLDMYNKNRRQAPIYWPISTESGSYTLWFYYHRLTDQTLYKAVNDFVDPKLKETLRHLADLRAIKDRTSSQEKELAQLSELESELTQFKADLLEIAAFWKPNLNDGVQITAAPLWKFFRLTKWRNKLKKTWSELQSGKYDWAHLALSIWPDRVVREKCTTVRSIAIAHDLEEQLWHEVEVISRTRGGRETVKTEWQPRDLSSVDLDAIVAEVKRR